MSLVLTHLLHLELTPNSKGKLKRRVCILKISLAPFLHGLFFVSYTCNKKEDHNHSFLKHGFESKNLLLEVHITSLPSPSPEIGRKQTLLEDKKGWDKDLSFKSRRKWKENSLCLAPKLMFD